MFAMEKHMHQSKNATISLSFANIKLYILLALSSIFLASCGGSSSNDGSGGNSGSTITVGLFKGPTVGASCDITDASGKTINRITGPKGLSIESSSISPGILTVSCSGGTYIDEATNTNVDAPNMRAVAYYPGGDFEIIISPLSEIAYQRAIAVAGNVDSLDESKVNAESEAVATLFGLDEVKILQTIPTPVVGTEAATAKDDPEGRFAMVLAGLSKMIYDSQGGTSTAQVEAGIDALVKDLAEDGVFNTKGSLIAGINDVVVSNPSIDSTVDTTTLTTAISNATLDATATLTAVETPTISVSTTTQYVYVVNTAITDLVYSALKSSGGGATECSISSLPQGLQLNGTTTLTAAPNRSGQCVISGTPSTVTATASYTLTVSNAIGSESTEINLTVNPEAPNVADVSAQTLTKGTPATITFGNAGGTITSCTLDVTSDSLTGTGLSLNSNDCSITGTPNTVTTLNIVVAATNVTATDTANVAITINDEAPALQDIPTKQIFVLNVDKTITFNNAGGGTLTECSVSPALPTGLTIAPNSTNTTCEITGSATTETPVATYTITAKNATAQSTADVAIEVVNIIPVNVVPITSSVFENAGSVVAFRIETTPAPSSDLTGTLNFGGNASTGGHASAAKSTFTIAAGTTSTTLTVNVTDNEYPNSVRVFTAQVVSVNDATYGPGATGSLEIADNDAPYTVTVSGTNAPLTEADNAILTFTISTNRAVATDDAVTVDLSYGDSSTTADVSGISDFSNIPTQVVISAGENSATLELPLVNDNTVERTEYVNAAISNATNAHGGSFAIGSSQTATINDNDTYQISIAKIRDGAENNNDSPTSAQFAVTVTPANETGGDITGTLIYDGTADQGTDYTAKNTFSISNGASSDTIELPIRENPNGEGNQTIEVSINTSTISVSGGYDYSVAQDSATASIIDDDITQIIINRVTENVTESSATGVELFTVSVLNADSSLMTNNGLGAISGTITFSGDAFTGNDVTTPSATTFNFPLGSITNPQTITFNINQDTTPENTEQITAQITAVVDGVNADSYSVNTNPVSVGVEDDSDNYTITIGSPVNATEGGTNPQFTLTTDPAVASGDTITVNLSYTGSADTTGTSDFSNLPDSATITTGTTGTLILTLATDDGIVELDETVIATIDSATNANGVNLNIGTPNNSSTATINDNDTHSVSIAKATDGDGTEDSNDNTLEFVISVTPPNTQADITGTLILSGTNVDANDFTGVDNFPNVPFTITTSDNGSQTITIGIADPDDAEGLETVIATLNNSFTSGGYSTTVASNNSANATITDNDITTVKIRALPTTVAESDTNQTISYEVYLDGSAVGGAINPVSGTITFSGATTQVLDSTAQPFNITSGSAQTIQLTLIGDTTPEAVSTLTATIEPNSITNTEQFQASSPDNSATITITDDDNYTITIGSPVNATEGGTNPQFTLTTDPAVASGDTITVNLSYTGSADTTGTSDFSNLPDSATITTGTTGTLTLTLADDGIIELDETVIATIDSATNANGVNLNIGTPNNSQTATINDNDTHSVSIAKATDGDGTEDSNDNTLEFVISVTPPNTQADITGTLILSGTNVDANDFTGVDNFPNVPFTITTSDNGSQTITIGIADPDDAEGLETVIATLNNSFTSGGYSTTVASNNSANATITDNDITTVKIRALPTTVAESDTNQTISYEVYLDGSAVGGAINPVSGTITFSGATTQVLDSTAQPFNITSGSAQTIQLTLIGDTTPEAVSTLTATIEPNSITNTEQFQASSPDNSATITITDDDNYTITIGSPVNATEGGTNPQFTLTTDPAVASGDTITVNLSYTGSADTTGTSDFSNLPDSATITTGTTGTLILTLATDDGIVELDETVIATIDSATNANGVNLNIGTPNNSSTATINDNDTHSVSIAKATDGDGTEDSNDNTLEFVISVTPPNTQADITGTLILSGTNVDANDFTGVDNFPNVPFTITTSDNGSQTITIGIADPDDAEGLETVIATLNNSFTSGGYSTTVASNNSANATITDNDITTVKIRALPTTVAESDTNQTISYEVYLDGSAVGGAINPVSGTITFSGATTQVVDSTAQPFNITSGSAQTIQLTLIGDTTPEAVSTLTATIEPNSITNTEQFQASSPDNSATITITDDDNYTITIGSPVNATEGGTNPQFTLTTDPAVASGDTITVNLSYTGSADTTGTSDFSNLPDSATITTGTTGTLTLTLADDGIIELDETVIATIDSATNANGVNLNIGTPNNSQTATINDNDTHSVSIAKATDGDGTEDSNDNTLEFVISVTPPNTQADITGTLILSGTNVDANDFTGVDNFPNVPFTITTSDNGSQTITIGIADPDDAEGLETVIATLNNSFTSGGYSTTVASNNSANATITDNDITTVKIRALPTTVAESDTNQTISYEVYLDGSAVGGAINPVSGTITFSGATTQVLDSTAQPFNITSGSAQTIQLTLIGDTTPEAVSTLTATIEPNSITNTEQFQASSPDNSATITITDDDNYTITIGSPVNATEGGTNPQFTLTTDPAVASGDTITVNLSYTGSADTTGTSDFSNLPDSATITTGTTGTLTLTLADDGIIELDETVIATIDSATNANGVNLNIGTPNNSQTATINDNDTHSVSIAKATDGDGTEDSNDNTLEFVISVTPPNTQADITGTLILSGTNVDANDFTGVDNFPNVPFTITTSDNGSQTITIGIADPDDAEGLETVIATLNNSFTSGGYSVTVAPSPDNSATATITDNDIVNIATITAQVGANSATMQITNPTFFDEYTVYLSNDVDCDTANYSSCTNGQTQSTAANQTTEFTATSLTLDGTPTFGVLQTASTQYGEFSISLDKFNKRQSQVVEMNGDLYVIGGNAADGRKNDVWKSSDNGQNWVEVLADNPNPGNNQFTPRSSHRIVVKNDVIYVIGGFDTANTNDVWKSTDGETWEEVLRHTNNPGNNQFTPRRRHQVVVKDDEMYLIGGNGNSARLNDVWKSTDNGETWEEVTENAAFTARQDHQVVVKGSEMYLIGGSATDERKNDVWKSTNGETWTLVISNNNNLTDDSHFSPRWGHQVVVKDDQMYLIGGTDSGGNKNDVWKSNGGTWTLVISHDETPAGTQFSARNTHQVVVLDDDMYLISGIVGTDERTNDVWKSTDGRDWKVVNNSSAEFTPREHHRVVEMDGELYLIGGDDGIRRNDIWKSTDTGKTWTQVETEGTIFSARRKHQVVVKGSDMYVIGGNDGLHKNDVWKSDDKGVTWTELTKNAAFTARGVHQVVVIDNTMYLMGGWLTTQNITNDVWSSTDGQNWTRVTPTSTNSVFSERYAHQVVTLGEDMYLIGGRDKNKRFNDIWKSTDKGKTWAEVTTTGSKFTPRRDHQVLGVGTNTMYVIGGRDDSGRRNDIWKSTDQGVTWTEISEHDANSKTKFAPRQAHQVVAIDGTMFVIGGHTDDGYVNDVWSSTDGENWLFHAKAVVALKKDQPELSNTGTTTATFGDAPLTVSTEGGTGTGTVSASSSNAGVATVSGTQITITGPGTTTITITKAGDDNYYETSDTYTLTVGLKPAYTVSVQSVGNTTVTEGDGNNLQFKVELDRAVETGDSVTAQINYSGTANSDNDTTNRQTSVTIPAGTNTAMVSISVQDDNIAEVAKQLVVTLNTTQQYYSTNKNPITVNTNAQSVIFTINDDEFANTNNTNITGHNAQAYTATVNIAFSQTFTNTGGPATGCSIAPVLPAGISINLVNGTCEISGTATENIESLNYTVSASNIRGTSTATISFEVVDAPNITALQPLVQVVQGQNINQPITLTSNSGGPITEYEMVAANGFEVDVNLGLNFDTLTGQLSGNPSMFAAPATYTITATGPNGATSQATVQIEVTQFLQAPQISDLTYNATTEIAIPASTVILPNTGGAIDTWEIAGTGVTGPINDLYTIGNGLTFNERTGEVGGTPAGPAAETNYTVTARNNSGFNSATLTLTVLSKPVSNVNVPMTITSYPIMSGQTESNIDVRVEVDTDGTTNTYEVEYRFKSDNSGNWSLNLRTATPFSEETLPDFATYNNGDTLSYRVTVTNAQNAINQVTKQSEVSTESTYAISDSRVIEGVDGTKTMVFTIFREGNNSQQGSVEFAVDASSSAGSMTTIADLANTYESGTGTVDNDYVGATSGTVTFPAGGAQVQTIEFTINGDYWKEFNQKIVVTIGTPTGGTILRSTGIGVINEVDAGAMTGLFALTDLNPEKVTYAIRVRRSSDNVEQDIGFDHNGNLDTTALLAFVGTGANDHGYVSVWYDQSDYDQNLTQVNRDQQGTIVSAGQLVVGSTGEPVISFNEGLNGAYDGFNNDFDYMQMQGDTTPVENLVIDFTMQVNTATSSALANFGETNQNGNYANRITIHPMNLAAGGGETTFFDSNKGNINNSAPDATKQTLGELEQVNFALSGDNNANAGTATLNNTDAARVMFINGESVSNHAGGLSDNIVLGPTWYIGAAAATTQNVDLHQPMPVMLSEFSLYESNELQTAANAFTGSSNNDVFTYAGDLENIDGSAGYDVLYINSNTTPTITLDTTANSATSTLGVNSIERIIAAGNGQNDVITITDALVDSTDEDVIEIQMDSTDTLTLPNSFNVGSSATETYNGISYTVYTHNTNTALRVFVSGSPTVSN